MNLVTQIIDFFTCGANCPKEEMKRKLRITDPIVVRDYPN